MEWRLVKIMPNLAVLQFESFKRDMGKFFSTKWSNFRPNMRSSKTSGAVSSNKESLGEENGINIAEINLMMSRLGMGVGLEECNKGNKSFDVKDFSALFDEEEPSLDEIKEAFGVFDVNKDGFIDASELQGLLCNLGLEEGCECNLEECRRMIKTFDCNRDGVIDFEEFVKFMEKCL